MALTDKEDAEQPFPDELPYCAAKAAILNLSRTMREMACW